MRFTLTADQRLLRDAFARLLAEECAPEDVRAGRSPARWRRLAEMGAVGALVPAAHGGLGLDETSMVLLLEEAGRACLPEPLGLTAAVVVPLLVEAGGAAAEAWLPRIAAGELMIDKVDGDLATLLGPDEDRGALAAAAELSGAGRAVIDMGRDYALQREQFGRPIGAFQAVKHHLASALVRVEFARTAVYRAAWSIAGHSADRARDVSMAKALASDAALQAARTSLQVHGAIGYTDEHHLHLWLERIWSLSAAWGDAARHRDRLAGLLGL